MLNSSLFLIFQAVSATLNGGFYSSDLGVLKQTHGKTISRILWSAPRREPMSIPLGPLLRGGSSCLPGSRNRAGHASWLPYLALHRIRHSWQALSPRLPVVSYTAISPLPGKKSLRSLNASQKGACRAVCFCGAAPHCCGFPLGSILPCGVRTFLSSQKREQRTSGFPMGCKTSYLFWSFGQGKNDFST